MTEQSDEWSSEILVDQARLNAVVAELAQLLIQRSRRSQARARGDINRVFPTVDSRHTRRDWCADALRVG
ncbi:MAG: hypothetical protein ACJAZO_003188 [Myxococcota bacterium]|jgi:hypothetical protein